MLILEVLRIYRHFAFMSLVLQLLRRDEATLGMLTKPRRPRAVVLCPTRELSEQVLITPSDFWTSEFNQSL